jgi:hypothetical protein
VTAVAPGRGRAGRGSLVVAGAWSAGLLSLAGFAASWALTIGNHDVLDVSAVFGPDRFMVMWAVVGAFLAARRPANLIGWLLLSAGFVTSVRALAGEYALHAAAGTASPALAVWAAWYVNWSLTLLFPCGVITFLLLLFPSGRLLTRRWRFLAWGAAGLSVVFLLMSWLDSGPVSLGPGRGNVPNPTGIRGSVDTSQNTPLGTSIWILGWAVMLAALVSVVVRYRRSGAEERLQLKWFAWAVVVSLGLMTALVPAAASGNTGQAVYDAAIVVGLGLALPLAIGVAVLKYRLYAIDKIISRTVSYALVTGTVVGVYLACVALLTKVLPVRGNIGIAVAVLAAAALFNPLRRRIQGAVDRRFNRARYDVERVVEQFSVQLRDQVDLDVLSGSLLDVVDQVLAPEHVTLWLSGAPADQHRQLQSPADPPCAGP